MTYNIRHAQGMDGRVSNARIASVITEAAPDVVAIQESWRFPAVFDQAKRLGKRTGLAYRHAENHWWGPVSTGNSLFTRGTIRDWTEIHLEGSVEQRGCLIVETEIDGLRLNVASLHLSLSREFRQAQVEHLANRLPMDLPLIVGGDFNTTVTDLEPLRGILNLVDSPPKTYPSASPQRGIDHVLWSDHFELERIWTVPSTASDHLPLIVDLKLG